jgi:hypothetical protein
VGLADGDKSKKTSPQRRRGRRGSFFEKPADSGLSGLSAVLLMCYRRTVVRRKTGEATQGFDGRTRPAGIDLIMEGPPKHDARQRQVGVAGFGRSSLNFASCHRHFSFHSPRSYWACFSTCLTYTLPSMSDGPPTPTSARAGRWKAVKRPTFCGRVSLRTAAARRGDEVESDRLAESAPKDRFCVVDYTVVGGIVVL